MGIEENEVVQYGNSINDTALKGLVSTGLDLFFALCNLAKDKGPDLLSYDYQIMKKKTGMSDQSDEFASVAFGKATDIINRLRFAVHDEETGKSKYVTLFPTCENNPDTKTLTVRVNPDAMILLSSIGTNFTAFELGQFVKLKSKYSKNLFRLLKQFRSTGKYWVDMDKLRELMDCPENYPNREFIRNCINVAVKELNNGYFENLKAKPEYGNGRGKPIVKYVFTFKKQVEKTKHDTSAETGQISKQKYMSPVNQKNRFNNFTQRDIGADLIRQLEMADMQDIENVIEEPSKTE